MAKRGATGGGARQNAGRLVVGRGKNGARRILGVECGTEIWYNIGNEHF